MKSKTLLVFAVVLSGELFAQVGANIDSVWFSEETACDGENLVRVCYAVTRAPECSCNVDVYASADSGSSWVVVGEGWFVSLSDTGGDFEAVDSGVHCFFWDMGADLPDTEGAFFGFRVQAGCVCKQSWIETDFADFADGDTTANVKILSPDPDSTDDGALWIPPGRDTIYVLQVYPDGHCTYCMSSAIYSYMGSGTPPLNIKIYLITISDFNATVTSPASTLSVQYIDPSNTIHPAENLPFSFFDVVMFGVADCYASRDLTSTSAQAVRQFAQMGKGVLLTHDTATNWSSCAGYHQWFASLNDITGIDVLASPVSYTTYTSVVRVVLDTFSVLHYPFDIPDTFSVLRTHWLQQVIVHGTMLYRGLGAPYSTYDNGLYWQFYHNLAYNSFSSFFSYGHTESVPAEWEAKAMINSIYYSYRGGIGNGVYTSSVEIIPGGAQLDTFEISVDVPTCGSFYRVEVAVDTCIDDTVTPTCWTSWVDITDSVPSLPTFDAIKYRIGFSLGIDCGSPVVHWVRFVFRENSSFSDFSLGILDSRAPTAYSECWADSVLYVGDSISIRWHADDLYPTETCSTSVEIRGVGCDLDTVFSVSDTELVFPVSEEFRGCESVEFYLTVPDSFCNTGHDTCSLELNLCSPAMAWTVCPPAGGGIITTCGSQNITFAVLDTAGRTVDSSAVFITLIHNADTIPILPDSLTFEREGDTLLISVGGLFSDSDTVEVILDSVFATDGCKIFP